MLNINPIPEKQTAPKVHPCRTPDYWDNPDFFWTMTSGCGVLIFDLDGHVCYGTDSTPPHERAILTRFDLMKLLQNLEEPHPAATALRESLNYWLWKEVRATRIRCRSAIGRKIATRLRNTFGFRFPEVMGQSSLRRFLNRVEMFVTRPR